MRFSAPTLIKVEHRVENFDCGHEALNLYLKRFALSNTAAGVARTWVTTGTNDTLVAGFYSLAAGSLEKSRASDRVAKGSPNLPLPVVLLARLAVDQSLQGRGIGLSLVRDALQRCLAAADVIGVRAVLVHAKDEAAARFYTHVGFTPSPTDLLHLMMLIKDVRRTFAAD